MTLMSFVVGLPAMLICLTLQVLLVVWSLRYCLRKIAHSKPGDGFFATIGPLLTALVVMTSGNILEIATWGVLFIVVGEFDSLYPAIYHSAVNFTSLGYGDVVMSEKWKLLGPLEAVNGILMLGMSAAALMAIFQEMIKAHRSALISR